MQGGPVDPVETIFDVGMCNNAVLGHTGGRCVFLNGAKYFDATHIDTKRYNDSVSYQL